MWLERILNTAAVAILLVFMQAIAVLAVFSGPASAHEAAPTVIEVTPLAPDHLALTLTIEPAELLARIEGVDHDTYADVERADLVDRLRSKFERLDKLVMLSSADGQLTVASKSVDPDGALDFIAFGAADNSVLRLDPSPMLGDVLVRVSTPAEQEADVYFGSAGQSIEIALSGGHQTSLADVATTYLKSGFEHILPKGLDHILFVIGLFLLAASTQALLIQVSIFTLAHTATLALASTGLVAIPASIVEPLIAASIAYVAIENIRGTSLSRWRPLVIFGFGLLHGLGFASVLADFGLPGEQFVVALVAFNIGVEVGQLVVLVACFLAVGAFLKRSWYRAFVSVPASIALAAVGMFWFVERIAGSVA